MRRICSLCDEEFELKSERHTPRVAARPLGIGSLCAKCKPKVDREQAKKMYKGRAMLSKYGITLADYYDMMFSQSGTCKICNQPSNGNKLAVDHCHKTGKVRGLLCVKCNAMLGLAQDNPDILINGANYIKKHRE